MSKEIHLPLALSKSADTGRALARVPMADLIAMGLRPGDTVAIEVSKVTHARVVPGPRDSTSIEVDAYLLANAGGAIGTRARLRPVPLGPLKSIIIKSEGPDPVDHADLSESLFDLPLTEGDETEVVMPMGRRARFSVVSVDAGSAGFFTENTVISLASSAGIAQDYQEIGGLSSQIERVHEMVATPLLRPDLFERLGISPPRGVLFTGPPGSGKTLLARTIAARTSAAFFQINGPEIVSKHYGDSEAALRKVFEAASKQSPAIIFIDEIDAIAPKREGLSGEKQVERRIVAQLLTLMDGLSERGRIVVMAATNLPDALDPALRRPGRFDREIGFSPPDTAGRTEILAIHLRKAPLATDVNLADIAETSHGYVGADLAAVAREAALAALARTVSEAGGEDRVLVKNLVIRHCDLEHGIKVTGPSALRATHVESPTIRWSDIGGLEAEKQALTEAVIWPLAHKTAFAALRIAPSRGILLSGPPGSGKTLLARALAHESGMNFIAVRPTQIMSQFLGDAERAVSEIFTKARQAAPTVIFFDELDALAPRRNGKDAVLDRIVAQLLTEMDGLVANENTVVLGATNRAAAVDPALTRPGRFDLIIPIGLPDLDARTAILRVHSRDLPLDQTVELNIIAKQTQKASGATLAAVVNNAARSALRRAMHDTIDTALRPACITMADFEHALSVKALSEAAGHADFISQAGA
jgi:transitional endoplasmic reticulum ATPase